MKKCVVLLLSILLVGCQTPPLTSTPSPSTSASPSPTAASPTPAFLPGETSLALWSVPPDSHFLSLLWLGPDRLTHEGMEFDAPAHLKIDKPFRLFRPKDREQVLQVCWGSTDELPPDQPQGKPRSEVQYNRSDVWNGLTIPTLIEVDSSLSPAGEYRFLIPSVCEETFKVEQEFLPTLKITSPSTPQINYDGKPLTIRWDEVPGAVAYGLRGLDVPGKETVLWFAPGLWEAKTFREGPEAALAAGLLFGPEVREATFPPGVFEAGHISVIAFSASQSHAGKTPVRVLALTGANVEVR